jgi:hypothetical protein
VNYASISQALQFYQDRGYVYMDDAPWHVGREAYYMTKPAGAVDVALEAFRGDSPNDVPFDRPYMVASGEQSFIQMMLDGQPIKRAICVTPCFRWEPRVDMLHRRYFMKAELINAQDVDDGHLVHMVHDACSFFESMGLSVRVLDTTPNPAAMTSFDIVEKGTRYELGSYGIRRVAVSDTRVLNWIYGTAVAEPRLETVLQRKLRSIGK